MKSHVNSFESINLVIIFEKNQNMKTEKVFVCITILGLILKYLHIPGGGPILVLSLLSLALIYFPFGFYFLSDKSIKTNTGISVVFGWLLSVVFIGILFRVMHWPGAAPMAIVGTITAIPLAIFSYIKHQKSNQEDLNYFKNLLIRTSILLIISTLLVLFKLPI
jgi:hypothetical protein